MRWFVNFWMWMAFASLLGALVLSHRSRTVTQAGCALLLLLVCFVALVWLRVLVV